MLDVPFIVCVVLAVPLVLFGDALRFNWGFRPDLAIIFVIAIAFSGRGRHAPLFGLILGLILDSLNYESTFTYTLGYFLIGYGVGYIQSRFLRRNLFFRCITLLVLYEAFHFYLIAIGSIYAGEIVYPWFHPGILAPGLFLSLLIFIPLNLLLDRVLPASRTEEMRMTGVFLR
jgi:rod shape-determining protein MreD